jgi:hypothetical protein
MSMRDVALAISHAISFFLIYHPMFPPIVSFSFLFFVMLERVAGFGPCKRTIHSAGELR